MEHMAENNSFLKPIQNFEGVPLLNQNHFTVWREKLQLVMFSKFALHAKFLVYPYEEYFPNRTDFISDDRVLT